MFHKWNKLIKRVQIEKQKLTLFYIVIWTTTWQNQQNECTPSEDSDQPGHPPSLIRVFAVRMKKAWVLRLWSDWSESSLGTQSLCWVCHVVVQFYLFITQKILHVGALTICSKLISISRQFRQPWIDNNYLRSMEAIVWFQSNLTFAKLNIVASSRNAYH